MTKNNKTAITVETAIKAPIEKVWKFWTAPEHITKWNNASDDWHTPFAENDLRVGGKEPNKPQDHGWMYERDFQDLDGHIWGMFYMDERKMPKEMKSKKQEEKL